MNNPIENKTDIILPRFMTAGVKPIINNPEFIRLPKPGTPCPWTGLSRSKMNQLILPCRENGNNPPVKSCCLRNQGAIRGTRLIQFGSLMKYLKAQTEGELS